MMTDKQLVKKLVKIMSQVKYIEKKGFNNFNKYKYATEADVNEKVREYLAEESIIMIPDMKSYNVREHTNRKGNIEYIGTAEIEFTFHDGDTGETLSFTTYGEGQDAGDKSVYKAFTGAQKYALMKAFMIPTGDDPETENNEKDTSNEQKKSHGKQQKKQPEQTITSNTIGSLKAIWMDKGSTEKELNSFIEKKAGCKLNELTEQQGIGILQQIESRQEAS
jgi:hypothetical protein